jgi:hypothetical protein
VRSRASAHCDLGGGLPDDIDVQRRLRHGTASTTSLRSWRADDCVTLQRGSRRAGWCRGAIRNEGNGSLDCEGVLGVVCGLVLDELTTLGNESLAFDGAFQTRPGLMVPFRYSAFTRSIEQLQTSGAEPCQLFDCCSPHVVIVAAEHSQPGGGLTRSRQDPRASRPDFSLVAEVLRARTRATERIGRTGFWAKGLIPATKDQAQSLVGSGRGTRRRRNWMPLESPTRERRPSNSKKWRRLEATT